MSYTSLIVMTKRIKVNENEVMDGVNVLSVEINEICP